LPGLPGLPGGGSDIGGALGDPDEAPSALFVTEAENRRVLGHVDRVDLSVGVYGSDFSAVVL
jgi:hypothetical protein